MKVTVTGNLGIVFRTLLKRWPQFQFGLMSEIGYQGRRALYENFLQGQVIDLRKYPHDIKGRRTVSYGISKRGKSVKISSYPLNLYNPKSVYNSARSIVESSINSALTSYDERVLQKRIDMIDKGSGK